MAAALGSDVIVPPPPRRFCNDDTTLRRTLDCLRRSLAAEERTAETHRRRALAAQVVNDQLYEDLNALLDQYPQPTPDQALAIADRFRATVTALVEVMPHLVSPYPEDTMLRLLDISAEHLPPQSAHGHARRFAVVLLSFLDLLGEDAL